MNFMILIVILNFAIKSFTAGTRSNADRLKPSS